MKKEIVFLIILGLLLIATDFFFFSIEKKEEKGLTGHSIKLIDKIQDIPENKSAGDCWKIKEINKIVCYEGIRSVEAGEVD